MEVLDPLGTEGGGGGVGGVACGFGEVGGEAGEREGKGGRRMRRVKERGSGDVRIWKRKEIVGDVLKTYVVYNLQSN